MASFPTDRDGASGAEHSHDSNRTNSRSTYLPLHDTVVLETDLIIPVAHKVLESSSSTRELQERRENGTLWEALTKQHAPGEW